MLAALGVLVAGFQHARLYHRGYAEVEVVGLLFFMNAIGSTAVVLSLVADRAWAFVLGALSICVPSLVSIAISHSSIGFLGFREGGYDADALVIVVAEVWAASFALAGAAAAVARSRRHEGTDRARRRRRDGLRDRRHWDGGGARRARARAAGGPGRSGRAADRRRRDDACARTAAPGDEGCDRCHLIAATGADGRLGPRLDTLDDDLDDVLESIADPRDDIADGYPRSSCRRITPSRLDDADLRALAAFVAAASGGETDESESSGGRRGRGRGRGGSDDG